MELSWHDLFMNVARLASWRSKDPSKKVGCCIVDGKSNRILSIGYNGFPRGVPDGALPWDKDGPWLQTKYPYVVHAEANAILNADVSLRGATVYVTLFPCNECAKLLVQAGVKQIYYVDSKTNDACTASARLLRLADIEITQYTPSQVVTLNTIGGSDESPIEGPSSM